MRVGVLILPEARWAEDRHRWLAAETLGFHHAWTYDHLSWRSFRDAPWFGALPILTAAAATTRRIRLGTLVATPNFRHPVPFAKELMTLDDISAGRITLGLGAGTSSFDAEVLGRAAWSVGERIARFEEFTALLDRLLREPSVSFEGRSYSASEARNIPGCVQRPRIPFAIAAAGPRAMRVAARYGDLFVTLDSQDAGDEQVRRLEDVCHENGRDPATLQRLALIGFASRPLDSIDAFRDALGTWSERGFSDLVVHWPRADEPFRGQRAVLDRIASDVLPGLG